VTRHLLGNYGGVAAAQSDAFEPASADLGTAGMHLDLGQVDTAKQLLTSAPRASTAGATAGAAPWSDFSSLKYTYGQADPRG
jgi:hypothetical protein